jgi:hypothetical protein
MPLKSLWVILLVASVLSSPIIDLNESTPSQQSNTPNPQSTRKPDSLRIQIPKTHTIKKSRYIKRKLLGSGASARVYSAYDIKTKKFVAVKQFFGTAKTREKQVEQATHEYIDGRPHDRIARLWDVTEVGTNTEMAFELLGPGTLFNLLNALKISKLLLEQI